MSTPTVQPVYQGYRFLFSEPTHGLFPASMAVTRVSLVEAAETGAAARPCLVSDPKNEFLRWNSALDDQLAVSEVFPIAVRDLGGGEARAEQILAAFHALDASLGLVYAVNELSSTETEMFGILYDVRKAQPIASLHTDAVSIAPAGTKAHVKQVDLWQTDSRALVRARFERLVHRCVRDLIRQDQPPPVEAPTGWTPAGPIRPVEWPPRRFRMMGR